MRRTFALDSFVSHSTHLSAADAAREAYTLALFNYGFHVRRLTSWYEAATVRRKRTWTAAATCQLFADVEVGLLVMNLKRDRKKAVPRVIALIRKADPGRYSKYSVERLRQIYYGARRRDTKRIFSKIAHQYVEATKQAHAMVKIQLSSEPETLLRLIRPV